MLGPSVKNIHFWDLLVSVSEAASLSPFSGLLYFTAIPIPVHLPPTSLCLSALQRSLSFCLLVPSLLLTPPILPFYFVLPSLSLTPFILLHLFSFWTLPLSAQSHEFCGLWHGWWESGLYQRSPWAQHLSFLSKNALFQRASEWIPPMGLPVNISSESCLQSMVLLSFLFHGKDSTVLSYALCTS